MPTISLETSKADATSDTCSRHIMYRRGTSGVSSNISQYDGSRISINTPRMAQDILKCACHTHVFGLLWSVIAVAACSF